MLKKAIYLVLVSGGLFAFYCAYGLFNLVAENKAVKQDLAEINRVNYELFNIQLWKDQAFQIFRKKIREFEFSDETYDMLDQQIQGYINKMYQKYFVSGELLNLISENLEKDGKVNKMFINIIKTNINEQLDELNLVGQIPGLSNQIIEEIRTNEPLIKEYLQQELFRLLANDVVSRSFDRRRIIYQKYGFGDQASTESYLENTTVEKVKIIQYQIKIFVGLLLVLLIAVLLSRNIIGFTGMISALTVLSILLLILGISMPMIDIDARLQSFSFSLMSEPIDFDEQVIFYQSKSIIEVTQTLWRSGGWDLKLVGVLVLLFSIVFPFFKLLLSALYLFKKNIRNNKLAQNVIFHLGKWSMADVFVVALFMAYIGLYGLIASQLSSISQNQSGFAVETINYSQLAPGAFFFTSYTLLSIYIGILISRKAMKPSGTNNV